MTSNETPASAPAKGGSKLLVGLLVVVFLVVGVGAGALWWIFSRPGVPEGKFIETTLKMAPENAPIFAGFNLAQYGWDEKTFQGFLKLAQENPEFQDFKVKFKEKMGFELDETTVSWLAPKSMAFYVAPSAPDKSLFDDVQNAKDGMPTFDGLAIFELNNKAKMVTFLDKFAELINKEGKVKLVDEDFKGTTVHQAIKDNKGFSWAVKDGMAMVGFTPQAVKSGLVRLAGEGKSITENAAYKQAMAGFKKADGAIFFVDLKAALKGMPVDQAIQDPLGIKLFTAMEWLALAGSRADDGTSTSEWLLRFGFPEGDAFAKQILPAPHAIEFKSVTLFPKTSEMYFALNLRTIWDIAYAVMGEMPEQAPLRDMPELKLKQMGIDLEKDIFATLTGEIAYSMEGLSKIMESYRAQDSDQTGGGPAAAFSRIMGEKPSVLVALGIKDQAKANELLNRLGGPLLMSFQSTDHKGTKIYSSQDFAYAFVDDFLVLATPNGKDRIAGLIDGKGGESALTGTPHYKTFSGAVPALKPLMLFYYDVEKYYQLMEQDPKTKEILTAFPMRAGDMWGSFSLTKDGVSGVNAVQIKEKTK